MTRSSAAVLAGGTALALAMSLAMPGVASAAPAVPADFRSDKASNLRASLYADDLRSLIEDAGNFAGVRITSAGVEVSVVGEASTAERDAVSAAAKVSHAGVLADGSDVVGSVPVTFRRVKNTLTTLTDVTGQLGADNASLRAAGIALSSWGPVVQDNKVVVHLEEYSEKAAAELVAKYGDAVSVEQDSQVAVGASRTADSAPWFGGDKITHAVTGGTVTCTSWFSATKSGSAVSATAGHCGTGAWKQNGNTFGTVSSSHFGGSMDGEIIPVSSASGYVWSDPNATTRAVRSVASSDPEGSEFCTDGQTDREVCGIYIYATGQSVTYNNQTITGLVYGVKENGQNAFSQGDSGGPAYTIGSNGVVARGMIEAKVSSGNSKGWYMPARTVQSYFSISVKTV